VAIAGGSTLATYQYAGSRVPSLALPNNVTRTQTYDALLRSTLVEYKQNTASQKKFEYVYNLADYRLLEKRYHSGGTGDNYDLDSIYRSVNVKAGVTDPVAEYQNPGSQTVVSTTGVTYDAAQSRSQVIVTAGGAPTTTNYTTDALNFYTAIGGVTHVRDPNGNLKDDGTNLYDYDYRNQLVGIRRKSDLAVIGTYEYDGICRRIAKSTSAGTTSFYWIGFELAMEYDASGLFSRRQRGAGFNEVVSAYQRDVADLDQDGSTTDYVPLTPLYDGAYDCIGVLDQTGAVAESYLHTYDGAVTITNAAGGTIPASTVGWRQGYGQMHRDQESGFLYAVHRHYDPATGRPITEDPLGRWFDRGGIGNGYAWCGNSFRNSWDPLGLDGAQRGGPAARASFNNRYEDAPYIMVIHIKFPGGKGKKDSDWGHAWVSVHDRANDEQLAVGFYPAGDVNWCGTAHGKVANELKRRSDFYLRLIISEDEYKRARAKMLRDLKRGDMIYNALTNSCVDYVCEVAEEAGQDPNTELTPSSFAAANDWAVGALRMTGDRVGRP